MVGSSSKIPHLDAHRSAIQVIYDLLIRRDSGFWQIEDDSLKGNTLESERERCVVVESDETALLSHQSISL